MALKIKVKADGKHAQQMAGQLGLSVPQQGKSDYPPKSRKGFKKAHAPSTWRPHQP